MSQFHKTLSKTLLVCIGNILEWYDFTIFGYLAPVMATLFFPTSSGFLSLLGIYGIFAVGLIARPLGSFFFSEIGDRQGRKQLLVYSVAAMSVPTLLIGVLPTYSQIGIWAPILLIVVRFLQGMAVGGEFMGCIVYVVETAPKSKKAFWSSCIYSIGSIGVLAGCGSVALLDVNLTTEEMAVWGWRVLFFTGLVIAIVAYFIRRHMPETKAFEHLKKEKKETQSPIRDAFLHFRKQMLIIFALIICQSVGYYLIFLYLGQWLNLQEGKALHFGLSFIAIGLGVHIISGPVWGHIADKIGARPILLGASFFLMMAAYPVFRGLEYIHHLSYPILGAVLLVTALAILIAAYQAPLPLYLVSHLPVRNRYTPLAIGYNTAAGFIGGTTPLVASFLAHLTESHLLPSFYLTAAAGIACITLACNQAPTSPIDP